MYVGVSCMPVMPHNTMLTLCQSMMITIPLWSVRRLKHHSKHFQFSCSVFVSEEKRISSTSTVALVGSRSLLKCVQRWTPGVPLTCMFEEV